MTTKTEPTNDGMVKYINLTQRKVAIVDADDYEWVNAFNWYVTSGGYAARYITKGKKRVVFMHREINKTPGGMKTDHINRESLDNRKANLRSVTHSQNIRNARPRTNNTSSYKGVSFHKYHRKWCAGIKINGKRKHLGYFDTEIEAAEAYKATATQYYGEFAYAERAKHG